MLDGKLGAVRLKLAARACIYRTIYTRPGGVVRASYRGCFAGQETSIHSCCASEANRRGELRVNRERLNEARMVDLLGMFRRRPAKRGPAGFARSHADITALGDAMGDMLSAPVRDAPPLARQTPVPKVEAPLPEKPRPEKPRQAPRAKTNGAGAAPRLATRAGYLAVHSVEKSFGTRQVVRGVSIYVRRGEG